jgi:hypothetical protein
MQKYESRNGKKKNQNQKRDKNLGIIRIVNNGRQDDQKRYNDHYNSNQNSHCDVTTDRKYNQRRYNNQNKCSKKNRGENRNTHDKQDTREDFQNRRDFQNKQSDIPNRGDFQTRQDDMNKLLSIQQKTNKKTNDKKPIMAHQWRVVCDSMLGGLSSRLRMCGVDCVHVLFDQSGEDSVKLAKHENRVLLTREENYEKVRYILYYYNEYEDNPNKHLMMYYD